MMMIITACCFTVRQREVLKRSTTSDTNNVQQWKRLDCNKTQRGIVGGVGGREAE